MHAMALNTTNFFTNSPEICIAKSVPKKSIPQQVANSLDINKACWNIFQHMVSSNA